MGLAKKVKLTIRLNDDVTWVQQNKVNVNEMGCDRRNKWDGLWTEENKLKREQ